MVLPSFAVPKWIIDMKCLVVLAILPVAFFAFASNAHAFDEQQQAAAAMKILDAWHGDQPEPRERTLHLVCWTPSDREFPADDEGRLTRMMQHIQNFYLTEMERLGLGSRTIHLAFDDERKLILHRVTGAKATEHYAVDSGQEIRNECLPTLTAAGIDPSNETILILCNLATWDEQKLTFTHKSPYYAGGSYRSGTAWQLDSPELDPRNLKRKQPIIRDGQYGRISLGKHNSIFIGGVAHELGHALGLPHCKQRPDQAVRGTALMGSGNRTYGDEIRGDGRGSFLTLAHGLRLASHPQFSGSVKGINQRAAATMEGIKIDAVGKAIRVSGVVQGTPPVYAVVAYFDPEGGGDYNATTATAVPAADGTFTLSCDALPPESPGELRLFPLHANGSAAGQMSRTPFRYSYKVNGDGTPDLSTIQAAEQLEPVINALNARKFDEAKQLATNITSPKAAAIAKRLTQPVKQTHAPADFDGDGDTFPLSEFLAESTRIGWGSPAFDSVPEPSRVLNSGGDLFETGLYAHAPARHVYRLDGKWQSLSGSAGLASGHPGSVQFEIQADGQSLWKSATVKSGTVTFDVKLDGVKQFELLTHTTDDGAGADWGLWLEPMLTRSGR